MIGYGDHYQRYTGEALLSNLARWNSDLNVREAMGPETCAIWVSRWATMRRRPN